MERVVVQFLSLLLERFSYYGTASSRETLIYHCFGVFLLPKISVSVTNRI